MSDELFEYLLYFLAVFFVLALWVASWFLD
jgi:hypothetical protein